MRRALAISFVLVWVVIGCREEGLPVSVGTLERHRIELRAEKQETIVRLAVSEGDVVEAGEVVAELDSRRLTAQLAQAEATRDLQAARLAEVVRGSREEEIDQARAQLEEAEAALVKQRPDLIRVRNLVADGVLPQADLDTAEATHAAAEARRQAAHAVLEKALNGSTVEELDQARATVARSEAEIARLEIDVERLMITAPRAGIIDALPFRVGDEPPVGAAVAVILTDGAPFARVYVPAEIRPRVTAGRTASVKVDGFDTPFEGRVRLISSEAAFTPYFALTERDRGHFAYLAEIDLTGSDARELPTGLPVEVTF